MTGRVSVAAPVDSAMIAVLAGTDPESDVVDKNTVRVGSVRDEAGTTKLLRLHLPPPSPTTTIRTYYGAHERNSGGHP